jgi:hypothetical protein
MDETTHTIGLAALLSEVDRDLEEFRTKHPGDFGVKNISLWWELERERTLARHAPGSLVKRHRRARSLSRWLGLFTAAWAVLIVVQAALRLLLP